MDYHAKRMQTGMANLRAARSMADAIQAKNNVTATSHNGWMPIGNPLNVFGSFSDRDLSRLYSKADIVRACVAELATSAAEGRLEVGIDTPDGFEVDESSDVLNLFYKNDHYSYNDLIQMMVKRLSLTGATISALDKFSNRTGFGDFVPVPTQLVQVITDGPDIVGYKVRSGDDTLAFGPDEMSTVAYLDPTGYQTFSSPMGAALREYEIDRERQNITGEALKNKDRPGMMFKSQNNTIKKEQIKQFKESLHEAVGGDNANRLKSLLLPGNIDPVTGEGIEDVNFEKLTFISETRICMVYGVPPIIIGSAAGLQNSSYANYSNARQSFYKETMLGLWTFLAEGLTFSLLKGETQRIRFNTDDVSELQDNRDETAKTASLLFEKKVATRNESRALVGLDPVDGGDEFASDPVAPTPVVEGMRYQGKADKPLSKAPSALGGFDDAKELEGTLIDEFIRQEREATAAVKKNESPTW